MKAIFCTHIVSALVLTGCLSCSRSIEPMGSFDGPFKRANFVLVDKEKDTYSSYAVLDGEPITPNRRGLPVGVPLFEKSSKAISYLLNGQPTKNRKAVKAILERDASNHNNPSIIKEILVQENKESGKKLVVINYED